MSGRRINVDLGPLTLSLIEGASPPLVQAAELSDDVQRLQALVGRGAGSPDDCAGRIEDEEPGRSGHANSVAGAPGLHGLYTLDDANVELLAFELSAAFQAADLKHAVCSSEVRLALRPAVLRDAELGVIELEGTLEFSLWVGNDDDCQWLAQQLPRLAGTLGEKLRRRLRMRLFGRACRHLLAEQSWPAGDSA